MKTSDIRQQLFFKILACLAQLAALFPFAVLFEALAMESLVVWHFAVIYAVWTAFRIIGWLVGRLFTKILKRRLPKKLIPIVNFLDKLCVLLPIAAYIFLGMRLNVHIGAFFYLLPAAVVSYYGGERSVGKSYSDIFTKAWFALFVVSALVITFLIAVTKKTDVSSTAAWLMCPAFGVVVLLSALLANQTNIDSRTKQRSSGKSVLPVGLRRYNMTLVILICTLTLGIFLFSRQLGELIRIVISAIVSGVMFLIKAAASLFRPTSRPTDPAPELPNATRPPIDETSGADIAIVLAIIALIILVIVFRKQIAAEIKNLLAPLFRRRRSTEDDVPFADEITSSDAKQLSARQKKKAGRELARRYARETSPEKKFRLGYALFLSGLNRTSHKPRSSDTTDEHREKGEAAFGEDLAALTETYNNVRYGDNAPTAEELTAQSEFLNRIK